jgi:hypothetical protein
MAYSPNTLNSVLVAQANANKIIEIAQEPVGILDCVNMKFDDKRASMNEVVIVPIDPVGSLEAVQPAATPPQGASVTTTNAKITINNVQQKSRVLTGEDLRQLENIGVRDEILRQFIENGERLLRNAMAASAGQAVAVAASRATGKAGTTPFSRDLSQLVNARQILRDNGCPYVDVNLATNTSAYANALNLNVIQQAQQAGSDGERRSAVIKSQFGTMKVVEDSFIPSHSVIGSGAAYQLNGGVALGQTAIPINGGGATDTILYGDIITIAGDTVHQYCVVPGPGTDTTFPAPIAATAMVANTPYTILSLGTTVFTTYGAASQAVGVTFVANGAGTGTGTVVQAGLVGATGTIYIGNPGIRKAISTGAAITIGAAYTPSYMLEKSAVVGIARPPIGFDTGGYIAVATPITDVFGYSYNFIESYQWGQWSWFLQLAWGFATMQSEYVVPILG